MIDGAPGVEQIALAADMCLHLVGIENCVVDHEPCSGTIVAAAHMQRLDDDGLLDADENGGSLRIGAKSRGEEMRALNRIRSREVRGHRDAAKKMKHLRVAPERGDV